MHSSHTVVALQVEPACISLQGASNVQIGSHTPTSHERAAARHVAADLSDVRAAWIEVSRCSGSGCDAARQSSRLAADVAAHLAGVQEWADGPAQGVPAATWLNTHSIHGYFRADTCYPFV